MPKVKTSDRDLSIPFPEETKEQNAPMFLFFDTETTGVPRDYRAPISDTENWPRLVQLGWILTDDKGNEIKRGNQIVRPDGFIIPEDASSVHGITTDYAKENGKPLEEVLDEFVVDLNLVRTIVGHNIGFDQHIIGAELYRCGYANPNRIMDMPCICTMESSIQFCKIPGKFGYKWPRLQELYTKLFGHPFEDAHDAMADIAATKDCFFALRELGAKMLPPKK